MPGTPGQWPLPDESPCEVQKPDSSRATTPCKTGLLARVSGSRSSALPLREHLQLAILCSRAGAGHGGAAGLDCLRPSRCIAWKLEDRAMGQRRGDRGVDPAPGSGGNEELGASRR